MPNMTFVSMMLWSSLFHKLQPMKRSVENNNTGPGATGRRQTANIRVKAKPSPCPILRFFLGNIGGCYSLSLCPSTSRA